jgi:hypothetical protein
MMFTAQLCVVIGPILAFVAWLLAMIGVNKYPTGFFLLMATGVQASSIVSSMSLCQEFWDCPWLLGSLSNIVATCLFFLCWILSVCGLLKERSPKHRDFEREGAVDHPSIVMTASRADSKFEDGSFLTSSLEKEDDHVAKEQKQSAEDLLGTNDPIILRAVSQSAKVVRDLTSKLKKRTFRKDVTEQELTTNPTITLSGSEDEEAQNDRI